MTSLQDAGGSTGEIARHAFLGHDLPTSLTYSVRAADHAIEALGFAEALTHLERALEIWSRVSLPEARAGRDQASLLTLASRCAGALGRWNRAVDLDQAALAHLDPRERRDERIVALLDMSSWAMLADDEVARAAAIREAADLVPTDPPSALRARVLSELARLADHYGQSLEARRLAEEAIELSRPLVHRPKRCEPLSGWQKPSAALCSRRHRCGSSRRQNGSRSKGMPHPRTSANWCSGRPTSRGWRVTLPGRSSC